MKNQKGQVLLIVVMLLATAITVVLSLSFTTTTDTKITKLEEESQKALAAAEAGIEAALETGGNVGIGGLAGLAATGITGDAKISNAVGKTFVTPLLQKDDQYTFYLAEYDTGLTPPFKDNSSYTDSIIVYYGTSGICDDIAVELTIIYDDPSPGYQLKRFVGDTNNKLGAGASGSSLPVPKILLGQEFKCSFPINISLYSNAKALIARPLFLQTKIGFEGANSDFKSQGNFITSTATSTTGVTKKVQLFQSYPQIPSEFFVTRF